MVTQPREGADSDVPSIKLPPIEEVFPLKDCMLVGGVECPLGMLSSTLPACAAHCMPCFAVCW